MLLSPLSPDVSHVALWAARAERTLSGPHASTHAHVLRWMAHPALCLTTTLRTSSTWCARVATTKRWTSRYVLFCHECAVEKLIISY